MSKIEKLIWLIGNSLISAKEVLFSAMETILKDIIISMKLDYSTKIQYEGLVLLYNLINLLPKW